MSHSVLEHDLVSVCWYVLRMCVLCSVCVPAGVSLATASVDALGQGIMQAGINHIQTDWLLVHLAAGVPVQHKHTG